LSGPRWAWCSISVCGLIVVLGAALAAGPERSAPRRDIVPDGRILLLQQEISDLTAGAADAVRYGSAKDAEWLRQIAAATRASAQAQVELLRQQNEIIRLLEQLTRGRETTR
jgi:hypothetical protein